MVFFKQIQREDKIDRRTVSKNGPRLSMNSQIGDQNIHVLFCYQEYQILSMGVRVKSLRADFLTESLFY